MTARPRLALLAAIAVLAPGASGAEPPSVVTSIKPVHSLVAGVMEGVGEPALLVPGSASPHGYGLRPSDAARLQEADLVFWIGPGLETFLAKPLEMASGGVRLVALSEVPGLTLHATREGGIWGEHEHEHDHGEHHDEHEEHHDDHGEEAHDEAAIDQHIWLDPENAIVMTRAVADALSAADPERAAVYEANGRRLEERLGVLDDAIAARLEPVRTRPFVVFHDAYQYLERHYGLAAAGAITVAPERAPGAQRLQEIHERLDTSDAVCVFSEPQFEPAVVETVVEGTDARTAVLDPLGAELASGPELYPVLLQNLAGALVDCLTPDRS